MKSILALVVAVALSGCDLSGSLNAGKYGLFETSEGVVYRLNTTTGETEVIYSPKDWPKLTTNTLYKGENEKFYEYLGDGQLKELSTAEVAQRFVDKYVK